MSDHKNIQAVLFHRDHFTTTSARSWLKGHHIKPMKRVHRTEQYLRYRIHDPANYSRMRTIHLPDKVTLIVGYP